MYMLGPNYQDLNRLEAHNPFELQEQIRNVLRLLRPQRAIGQTKARFGCEGDGGYVHLDDFEGVDTALSLGIDYNISWDRAAADRGLEIHQFDHTVEDPAPDDDRMIFNKMMIAAAPQPGAETLESIISRLDKKRDRPNLFLKMDIECAEWAVIEATSLDALSRFSQITCELHNFGCFEDLAWRQGFFRCLRKLSKHYAPIHIHANNFAGWAIVAGIPVPHVLEVSFANRALYRFEDSNELMPTPLDTPCNTREADMYLGNFLF
jgi:hypothetical protein